MTAFQKNIIVLLLSTLCFACTASLTHSLPVNPITTVSSADIREENLESSIHIRFPPEVVQNADLQTLLNILQRIAMQERESAEGIADPQSIQETPLQSFEMGFRMVSSTIRMVSIEGQVKSVSQKGDSSFSFHHLVFDRRNNRLISLSEMFEDKWPQAEALFSSALSNAALAQGKTRSSDAEVESAMRDSVNTFPEWVLLPGQPNRTSSGIRFDIAPTEAPSITEILQVEVPVSAFHEFLSDDWKQRFVKP